MGGEKWEAAERIEQLDAFDGVHGHLGVMKKRLSSPDMLDAEHGELEKYVIAEGRELQRLLLQAHMALRAARERPVDVRGADGVRRTTTRPSSRPLATLVGEVDVERIAYQARDVAGLHPMDASLNLPPEKYSHGVRRFVAEHAAIMSFDDVRHELVMYTVCGCRSARWRSSPFAPPSTSTRSMRSVVSATNWSRRRASGSARHDFRRQRHRQWCPRICGPRRKRLHRNPPASLRPGLPPAKNAIASEWRKSRRSTRCLDTFVSPRMSWPISTARAATRPVPSDPRYATSEYGPASRTSPKRSSKKRL